MKKLFLVLFLAGTSLTACKKEGCTNPLADNYDSKAKKDDGSCVLTVNPNTAPLCVGIAGNTKWLPLADNYKWTYERTIAGITSMYSEEIEGMEDINGISFYKVKFINNQLGTDGYIHYRIDSSNGNVYKRDNSGNEALYILGNPTQGASVGNGTISNMNATITTAACTYTGCIEVTESQTIGTKKTYFKKGLGVVKVDNSAGSTDVLNAVSF